MGRVPISVCVIHSLLQKSRVAQSVRSKRNHVERQTCALGYLHQAVLAVREVEHPQHRELGLFGVTTTTERVIEPAIPELRFAVRAEVDVAPVALKHPEDLPDRLKGVDHGIRHDEVRVVTGGVVLRICPVRGPGQAADAHVEPGRAKLPLVVAVRGEVDDRVGAAGRLQD